VLRKELSRDTRWQGVLGSRALGLGRGVVAVERAADSVGALADVGAHRFVVEGLFELELDYRRSDEQWRGISVVLVVFVIGIE